jgi:TolA-binding protein
MVGETTMRFWVLTVMAVTLCSPVAQAQMESREAIQLQNQILDMRRDMQALQQNQGSAPAPRARASGGDAGATNGLTAQLLDRVSTLEDQVRQLTGQVDQLTNQAQRQTEDFNKQIADMNFAMQNQGGGGGAPPPRMQAPPPSVLGGGPAAPPVTPAGPPPRTPELAMQEGNAALARRDYPAASAAAKEVIAKKGPRAADGQFLLAQAEMGQRNFQQAAPDYYDAYNRARTGPHAADALLGVANALIGIGDKPSACEALTKLRAEFPQPRPDIREGELAGRQRAGCH